jgi:hypothetical protein
LPFRFSLKSSFFPPSFRDTSVSYTGGADRVVMSWEPRSHAHKDILVPSKRRFSACVHVARLPVGCSLMMSLLQIFVGNFVRVFEPKPAGVSPGDVVANVGTSCCFLFVDEAAESNILAILSCLFVMIAIILPPTHPRCTCQLLATGSFDGSIHVWVRCPPHINPRFITAFASEPPGRH